MCFYCLIGVAKGLKAEPLKHTQILNSEVRVGKPLNTKVLHVHVVLMNSKSAKMPNEFVGLKIAAISVLVVILLQAWSSPFYRLRNSHLNYVISIVLSTRCLIAKKQGFS